MFGQVVDAIITVVSDLFTSCKHYNRKLNLKNTHKLYLKRRNPTQIRPLEKKNW